MDKKLNDTVVVVAFEMKAFGPKKIKSHATVKIITWAIFKKGRIGCALSILALKLIGIEFKICFRFL